MSFDSNPLPNKKKFQSKTSRILPPEVFSKKNNDGGDKHSESGDGYRADREGGSRYRVKREGGGGYRGNREDGGGYRGNREGGGGFRGNREGGGGFRGNREGGGGFRGNKEGGGGFRGNREGGGGFRGNREDGGGFRGNREGGGGFRGNREDGGGFRGNREGSDRFRGNREGGGGFHGNREGGGEYRGNREGGGGFRGNREGGGGYRGNREGGGGFRGNREGGGGYRGNREGGDGYRGNREGGGGFRGNREGGGGFRGNREGGGGFRGNRESRERINTSTSANSEFNKKKDDLYICGFHAVHEAMLANKTIKAIHMAKTVSEDHKKIILSLAHEKKIKVELSKKRKQLGEHLPETHGFVAELKTSVEGIGNLKQFLLQQLPEEANKKSTTEIEIEIPQTPNLEEENKADTVDALTEKTDDKTTNLNSKENTPHSEELPASTPEQVETKPTKDDKAAVSLDKKRVSESSEHTSASTKIASKAERKNGAKIVVALDGVSDSQNLGAIFRSSLFFSAELLVFEIQKSAPLNSFTHRASAGASLKMPFYIANKLSDALKTLQDEGYTIVGATTESHPAAIPLPKALDAEILKHHKTVLLMGGEEEGLRPHVLRFCNHLITIPRSGDFNSLNVSVASGVLLSHWQKENCFQGATCNYPKTMLKSEHKKNVQGNKEVQDNNEVRENSTETNTIITNEAEITTPNDAPQEQES